MNPRNTLALVIACASTSCALDVDTDPGGDDGSNAPTEIVWTPAPGGGHGSSCGPVVELSDGGQLLLKEYLCAPPRPILPDPETGPIPLEDLSKQQPASPSDR